MPSKNNSRVRRVQPKRTKVKVPFNRGDLVTGLDRSYKRSIYKFLSSTENPEFGLFEFQSLNGNTVVMYKMQGFKQSKFEGVRAYSEFRLAEPFEALENNRLIARDCVRSLLKKLGVYIDI